MCVEDLDYMHARYCSPFLRRFLSLDPLDGEPRSPQSWNRYSYGLNNPVRFIDPDGQQEVAFNFLGAVAAVESGNPDLVPEAMNEGSLEGAAIGAGVSVAILAGVVTAEAGLAAIASTTTFRLGAFVASSGLLVRSAPVVANPRLQRVINQLFSYSAIQLFKVTDTFPGGTAGALRIEGVTGRMLSPSATGHLQAGFERLRTLQGFTRTGGLSSKDVAVALRLQRDLQNGLRLALRRLGLTPDQIDDAIASGAFSAVKI